MRGRFGCIALLLFVVVVGAIPQLDSFQQSVEPAKIESSLYFFCLNLGKVPSQNSAANVSVQFYFDDSPTIEDVSIAWNSRNHTQLSLEGRRKIELFLTQNDLDIPSLHWNISLLDSGKFQGFIRSETPLRSVRFGMNSTRFEDVPIRNACSVLQLGIEQVEAVQQIGEIKSIVSAEAAPDDTPSSSTVDKDLSYSLEMRLNTNTIYIGTLFCFGLLIASVSVVCAFCLVKCHSGTSEINIEWGLEMNTLEKMPEHQVNSCGEEKLFEEYPNNFEKPPERVFVTHNPFDEVCVAKPAPGDYVGENLRSDSASSFVSLEPEELSSPFRYLLRMRIYDLIQLMVNAGRSTQQETPQVHPEEL